MRPLPTDLQTLLRNAGAKVSGSREIQHGTQYRLERGPDTVTLNLYSTGKVQVQGKDSGLKSLLSGWKSAREGVRKDSLAGGHPVVDATPRLGIDEAGKGDYFGPLVVAGVRILNRKAAERLQEIGVRDSKVMSGDRPRRVADAIREALGESNLCVVVLPPREYEAQRSAAGNVNRLLGEIDAGIINKLKDKVEVVVVDEFARSTRAYLEPGMPEGVRLEVRPRAEDDAAVAAASILARARFLEEMERLSERVGFRLPLGSTHVLEAGRRVVERFGEEGLGEVAKVHFGTTEQILGGRGSLDRSSQ